MLTQLPEGEVTVVVQRVGEEQWRSLQAQLGVLRSQPESVLSSPPAVLTGEPLPALPAPQTTAVRAEPVAVVVTTKPSASTQQTSSRPAAQPAVVSAPGPFKVTVPRVAGQLGLTILGSIEDGSQGIFLGSIANETGRRKGLHAGLQVLEVDGKDIRTAKQPAALELFKRAGDEVVLLVEDNPKAYGALLEATGELPGHRQVTLERSTKEDATGLMLHTTEGRGPVFVANVLPHSPASATGQVFIGDRVLALNGIDTTEASTATVEQALKQGAKVELTLDRDENEWAMTRAHMRQKAEDKAAAAGGTASFAPRTVSMADQGLQTPSRLTAAAAAAGNRRKYVVRRENGRFGLGVMGDPEMRGRGVFVSGVHNKNAKAVGVEDHMRIYAIDGTDVTNWRQQEVVKLIQNAGEVLALDLGVDEEARQALIAAQATAEAQPLPAAATAAEAAAEAAAAAASAAGSETASRGAPQVATVTEEKSVAAPVSVKVPVAAAAETVATKPAVTTAPQKLTVVDKQAAVAPDSASAGTAEIRHVKLAPVDGKYGMRFSGDERTPGPIHIVSLAPGGAAEKSKEILPGDRVLAINGVSTQRVVTGKTTI